MSNVGDERFATVTIDVQHKNDPPEAMDDWITTNVNTAVSFDVTSDNRFGADTDDLGLDPQTLVVVREVENGTLNRVAGSSFTYTPNQFFNGTDSFVYQIRDEEGSVSNEATVTIVVDIPPVARHDTFNFDEDTTIEFNVLEENGHGVDNDIDGSLDPDSIKFSTPTGSLEYLGDGEFRFEPRLDFFGTTRFNYRIKDDDGVQSNEATVTLNIREVNDPPFAMDDLLATNGRQEVTVNLLFENGSGEDIDLDGELVPSSLEIASQPNTGSVISHSDGTVTFIAGPDFAGSDSFTYVVSDEDGTPSEPATVTIVDESQPIATDDFITTMEDQPVLIRVLEDNGNGPDFDNGTLIAGTVEVFEPPLKGRISNLENGTILFTPRFNSSGVETFTYRVRDDQGIISDEATVTINIMPVADQPIASDDFITAIEDTPVMIDPLTNNGRQVDKAVDGDLIASSVTVVEAPRHGQVFAQSDGRLLYLPNSGFLGSDTFTYTVADSYGTESDEATVHISVNPLNAKPQTADDYIVIDEESSILIDVLADNGFGPDRDMDGSLMRDSVNLWRFPPRNGTLIDNGDGTFLYTPDEDFEGRDYFFYTLVDDQSAQATVTQSITEDLQDEVFRLDHRFAFDLESDADAIVVVANHDSPKENFTIDFSVNGVEWQSTNIVISTLHQQHSYELPEGITGRVWVRIRDLDSTASDNCADTVFVDELRIRTRRRATSATPIVSINNQEVIETDNSTNQVDITLTREGDISGQTIVTLETINSSAVAGEDYLRIPPRTVWFQPNQTEQTVRLEILGDDLFEADETLLIAISKPLNGRIESSLAEIQILNDDRIVGDLDSDGDVDTLDRTLMLQNWTGALDAGSGDRSLEEGDTDGDGDVDTFDATNLLTNWTGSRDRTGK